MAIGDVTQIVPGSLYKVELLASATATNGAPSGGSAGIECNLLNGFGRIPSTIGVEIVSTAGSGTMTVTARLWGYSGNNWFPLGNSSDGTTKGVLNGGNAITECAADILRHMEPVNYPAFLTRLYLEITAIGGTSTAVTGFVRVARDAQG